MWVTCKGNKVVRRAVIPHKCYGVKIYIMHLVQRADIKCRKNDILVDITSYGLIINIKCVKHAYILYNLQVFLVII